MNLQDSKSSAHRGGHMIAYHVGEMFLGHAL